MSVCLRSLATMMRFLFVAQVQSASFKTTSCDTELLARNTILRDVKRDLFTPADVACWGFPKTRLKTGVHALGIVFDRLISEIGYLGFGRGSVWRWAKCSDIIHICLAGAWVEYSIAFWRGGVVGEWLHYSLGSLACVFVICCPSAPCTHRLRAIDVP